VVEAPTPELTSTAARRFAHKLVGETRHFESVQQPGREFFEKNGLLSSVEEVGRLTSQLVRRP
jgi:hypothetical protein